MVTFLLQCVLRCVAVRCSALQCVAVCAVCCSALQCVLLCVAVCCSVLPACIAVYVAVCGAVCCSVLQCVLQCVRVCCNHSCHDCPIVADTSFPQKSPTFPQKSPTFPQKSPTFPQKSHILPHNCRYVNQIDAAVAQQKSPTFTQKSPTFPPKRLIFRTKALYSIKKPCITASAIMRIRKLKIFTKLRCTVVFYSTLGNKQTFSFLLFFPPCFFPALFPR